MSSAIGRDKNQWAHLGGSFSLLMWSRANFLVYKIYNTPYNEVVHQEAEK